MNNLKISIIIPVFNAEKYLSKCLNSISNQTYKNFEVIVINDGSTDDSLQICNKFSLDHRFVIVDQQNVGVSKTRNKGIRLASGDYICFVDSDDVLLDHYLDNYIQVLKNNVWVDIILQGIIYENGSHFTNSFVNLEATNFVDIFIYSEKNNLNYAPFNKLFNGRLIRENNIYFDENISYGEDYLFVLDVYLRSNLISFSKKSGYVYYINANENSLSKKRLSFDVLKYFATEVNKKRGDLFKKHIFPIDYIRFNTVDYYELLLRSVNEHYLSSSIQNIERVKVLDILNNLPKDLKKNELKHFDTKLIFSLKSKPILIQYLIVKKTNKLKYSLRNIYQWIKRN